MQMQREGVDTERKSRL